jgi:hypothetical protein
MPANLTDPTQAARDWLAANPEHDAAVHVREALASSARHEAIAEAAANAPPGGTYVVVINERGEGLPTFTAVGHVSEREIALAYLRAILPREIALSRHDAERAREQAALWEDDAAYSDGRADALERQLASMGDHRE